MPAVSSVHHSHQHAASLSTDNTHVTGHPLQNDRPWTSWIALARGTEVGTEPESRSRVYAPSFSGSRTIRIFPYFIMRLAFERMTCLIGQVFGSLIHHAAFDLKTSSSLRIAVIFATFLRFSVFATRRLSAFLSAFNTTAISAVGVSSVASAVNVKKMAAGAACDFVEFRCVLGEARFWTSPTTRCMMPLSLVSSEERGCTPPPPFFVLARKSFLRELLDLQFSVLGLDLFLPKRRAGSLTSIYS